MSDSILVTYATRYGSTREVAESIATTLRGQGLPVDVLPVEAVVKVADYRALVLGAPYYIGSMLKEARSFLERHRPVLQGMPVALFALGPVSASDNMAEAREQLDKTLGKLDWLKPASAEMFVGKYDPAVLRGLDKLVPKPKASPLHGVPAVDDRDWDAITRWAEKLPWSLGVVQPTVLSAL